MSAKDFFSWNTLRALPGRLARLYSRSLYAALLSMVFGGLAIPALLGGYVLLGLQERHAARVGLNETLQRDADILALGMQESLWNMNTDGARSLVESLMRDPAVLHVHVQAQGDEDFIDRRAAATPGGNVLRAERDVVAHGQSIGRVVVEMDDSRSQLDLRTKQWHYAAVLAGQLAVSLLLMVLLLKRRLVAPLSGLMAFSDRLSHGKFDSPLTLRTSDELGRLGRQMERMRIAIGELFKDIGRREERFRTIVTQVPGAVFRMRPGRVDFVSDAIESISGYPAHYFVSRHTDRWADIIYPEDRRRHWHTIRDALRSGAPYQVEYRILDANGIARWLQESGQPVAIDAADNCCVDGIIVDISERKDNEMRIEALLAEQAVVLDNVVFGILHTRQQRVVSTNRRFDVLFGYAEGELIGESVGIFFEHAHEYVQALASSRAVLAEGRDFSTELPYRRRDGSALWCSVSGRALDPARVDDGCIWVFADVTERRQAEQTLHLSATVLEHIADGVMVLDRDRRIVAVNAAFTQITGYTEGEAIGRQYEAVRVYLDEADRDTMRRELAAAGFWRGEVWKRRKNGEAYLEALTVSTVRDDAGAVAHFVCVFSDITKVKESQDKLDHLAHHDALTGLPNRLLFHDRLQHAMARVGRTGAQLAVLFIDLDRFKTVNDTLGHHVGDELLKQVAHALSDLLRDGDTLARLGGDEFIVLLENVDGERGARRVAEKLMMLFERPATVAGYELFVTGSVGISLFPQDATDMNLLIRHADVAMYQAKARGRNGYRFYAPSMDGDGVERLRLESLLRRAIDKGEISLVYQPQVEMADDAQDATDPARRRLTCVEALVRWHSPELGEVSPGRFIPLAEDIGFIAQLGAWVLEQACRQMVAWERAGLAVPKMAVNLSGRQFDRGSIAGMVEEVLRDTGLAPARLQLEVTESVIMNTGDALQFINDLHAIGVQLAIDDFGTGYSSLAYLKQLPVQTLKIDRSFIKDITAFDDSDKNDEAIAIAIIQLGKSMGLSVIAEGVESEAQAAFLLKHGCHLAQGYLYGRPMAPERVLAGWGALADALT